MNFVKEREFFEREGYLVLPGVLSASDADTLRAEVERVFGEHSDEAAAFDMEASWRPKMFEHGEAFERLIDHPGLIDLAVAEHLDLGPVSQLLKKFEGFTGGTTGKYGEGLTSQPPYGLHTSPNHWLYYLTAGISLVLGTLGALGGMAAR